MDHIKDEHKVYSPGEKKNIKGCSQGEKGKRVRDLAVPKHGQISKM